MDTVASKNKLHLLAHDTLLISIMAVLAACGLIYEYLLSHYAGRVLGILETAIYTMIGIMIVSMGLGALTAKIFKNPFSSFAWLEAIVALLGMSSVVVIAAIIALTSDLPVIISESYNLPPDTSIEGGFIEQLQEYAKNLPYFAGFLLGFLIGMEIPLIARVREQVYGKHLENNAGTIYGADYIGAGVGAFIWVSFMLTIDITTAAVLTAALNIIAGSAFLICYWREIKHPVALVVFHLILIILLIILAQSGQYWMKSFANVLYKDNVVYQTNTNYQNIVFTQRKLGNSEKVVDMYLNGRLQFSSSDEHIYHSMLIYPAMSASAHQNNVLIIGGGDGLGLRDVLKWDPQKVHLIDLDHGLVELYSERYALSNDEKSNMLRKQLLALNHEAFEDPRVEVIFGDAFIKIEDLLKQKMRFDTIIVDLPDPSHPDLNKLYSDYFYARLRQLLNADGVIAIQSTSPFHAQHAFISIGKTVKHAGFQHVEQYRQNVPSFGEWGWTIATLQGASASKRLEKMNKIGPQNDYISQELMLAAFAMPADYYRELENVDINYLGSGVLYQYHTQAWQKDVGVFSSTALAQ
ncbi:MAG: polyamine aminopropyltransferase [Kangiellaceae bacterium]|nr:polyamine aminopropyltransferase [Kangiellaceae bacterium]